MRSRCHRCNKILSKERVEEGYTLCQDCYDLDKYAGYNPHYIPNTRSSNEMIAKVHKDYYGEEM